MNDNKFMVSSDWLALQLDEAVDVSFYADLCNACIAEARSDACVKWDTAKSCMLSLVLFWRNLM